MEKRIRNKRDLNSYTLSLLFKVCIFGGLRATEACKVKFEDFGKQRLSASKVKLIDLKILGKGNKTAIIPLPYDYIKKEYLYFKRKIAADKTPHDELLFKSTSGKEMTRFILYRYFEEITKVLELGDKGVHILRHTWSSNLNDLGIDIGDIQILMRHSSITTTMVYVSRSERRIDSAVSKL